MNLPLCAEIENGGGGIDTTPCISYLPLIFSVKTLWLRDAAMEPIEVRFERAVAPEDAKDGETTKQIKRTLFQKMNPYPQKKAITFNRFSDDFKFTVWIGDQLAATADLSGVKEAHEKYSDAEPKGVKVLIDISDILLNVFGGTSV